MDKRRRLSAWLRGDGIEIGALNLPLGTHPRARVRYVDRLTAEEQRRQYPELAAVQLAPVDVIRSAEDLSAFDLRRAVLRSALAPPSRAPRRATKRSRN